VVEVGPLEISKKILEIEKKNNFFDLEFEGIKIYEHIRMFLYYSEILPALGIFEKGNYPKVALRTKYFINYFINSLRMNQYWGIKKHDILIVEDPNYSLIDGVKRDRFTSYFTKELNNNSFCILKSPLKGTVDHYKYGSGKKVIIDYYNILAIISSLISKISKKKELDYISKIIEKGINEGLNKNLRLKKIIDYYVINMYSKVIAARKLFLKIDPKLLITTGFYGKTFLTQVAKENSIPCIELQHGTIYDGHLGYHYPHVEKNSLTCFPDYILLFGEYWKNMASFPIAEDKLIPVGYPHYEHSTARLTKAKKNQILVISQNVQGRKLFDLSKELACKLNKYTIIYCLHPKQYYNWENNLGDKLKDMPNNLQISGTGDRSLYELMAESTFQIGIFSTALYEGLGLGLVTIVCKLPGWENMKVLIDNNLAYLLEPQRIPTFISDNNNIKNNNINPELFFKTNSIESIMNTIDNILNISDTN